MAMIASWGDREGGREGGVAVARAVSSSAHGDRGARPEVSPNEAAGHATSTAGICPYTAGSMYGARPTAGDGHEGGRVLVWDPGARSCPGSGHGASHTLAYAGKLSEHGRGRERRRLGEEDKKMPICVR